MSVRNLQEDNGLKTKTRRTIRAFLSRGNSQITTSGKELHGFKPSPIMVVRTKDGPVAMNRRTRRSRGIGVKHV